LGNSANSARGPHSDKKNYRVLARRIDGEQEFAGQRPEFAPKKVELNSLRMSSGWTRRDHFEAKRAALRFTDEYLYP
jgi:hypothetical protein